VAVRGKIEAKFMYIHHTMPEVATLKRCHDFGESYAGKRAVKKDAGETSYKISGLLCGRLQLICKTRTLSTHNDALCSISSSKNQR
jgi:hypothetical protein